MASLHLLEEVGLRIRDQSDVVLDVLTSNPELKKLHLTCSVSMPEAQWMLIISLCGNLREFELKLEPTTQKVLMNPWVFRTLLGKCRKLRRVHSRGCQWDTWSVGLLEQELLKIKPDCYTRLTVGVTSKVHL